MGGGKGTKDGGGNRQEAMGDGSTTFLRRPFDIDLTFDMFIFTYSEKLSKQQCGKALR